MNNDKKFFTKLKELGRSTVILNGHIDTEAAESELPERAGRLPGTHLAVLAEVLPVLSVCLLLSHHYHERCNTDRKESC